MAEKAIELIKDFEEKIKKEEQLLTFLKDEYSGKERLKQILEYVYQRYYRINTGMIQYGGV